MRRHFQADAGDTNFDAAVHVIGRRLTTLTCAVGTGNYFGAWLAALQLRLALDRGERVAALMASESRIFAVCQLN